MLPMLMPREAMARASQGWEAVKVLDIAAGHGHMESGGKTESPADLRGLKNVLRSRKMRRRWELAIAIIFFREAFDVDFGGDYDLALVTNFLHHFDPPTCTDFMKKVHALEAGRTRGDC